MRRHVTILILLAAAMISGCASANRHEIVVSLDAPLSRERSRPTIQVDLIGLDDAERAAWDEMSISTYWMPGSSLRSAARHRVVHFRFSPEQSQLYVVPIDSDIWKIWRKSGAKWLYVIANLPGGLDDKPGAADPRRLAVSLSSKEWDAEAPLLIEIRRDAVVFMTPPAHPE